jgi:hypothetical protein
LTSPAPGGGRATRAALPPLHTRPPTCKTAWPRIALPGPGGSGRSWQLAQLSGSGRVGRTLWLQLGESVADEYGLVPGARFEILEHDGTYHSIIAALRAAKAHAHAAVEAGDKPWVIGVDTISAIWDMLKAWADWRARTSDAGQAKLRKDPNGEVRVSMNIWEDVAKRWKEFMRLLFSTPWIVVMLANGKLVTPMTEDGKPDSNADKQYKIEARAGFDHLAFQIVRMSPDEPPLIVKLRTVHNGIRPGIEKPESRPDFSLEWLVFDRLQFDSTNASVPDVPDLDGGGLTEDERAAADDDTGAVGGQRHSGGRQLRSVPSGLAPNQLAVVEKSGADWVARALALSDVDTAAEMATAIAAHWSAAADILRFVSPEVRERLGVRPDVEHLMYDDLLKLLVVYTGKHKRSALAPLDEPTPAASPAAPGEESETDRQARLLRDLDEVEQRRAALAADTTTEMDPSDETWVADDTSGLDPFERPLPGEQVPA